MKEPLSISPPGKDQVSLATFHATALAGGTKYFMSAWREITADKQILEMVQGCPIEFKSMPKQLSSAHPFSLNPLSSSRFLRFSKIWQNWQSGYFLPHVQ